MAQIRNNEKTRLFSFLLGIDWQSFVCCIENCTQFTNMCSSTSVATRVMLVIVALTTSSST
jgi:hypothetical protein